MNDPFGGLKKEERARLRKREQPLWTAPMLARLSHDRFSDPEWIYERKLDGERALAFTEWTRDKKLRHHRFLGLRRDKKAKDVHREV